ncbi:putative dehydrogenase [Thioclava sp. ES.031]|uniref:Gfo/Idh/MocA family protein n=1 Tax=unclassified Thioclava TaxID=2621713 RepID=UPI000BF64D19|nr:MULTISPECIES: Gfo/Idh/MocA family oxidoreductase [unclassified Thioclava]MPQ95308.1 Gfo/Idh/MocA family oxidoreductase [Thioclava sp. JE_KL1]PFG63876.1 putative dehydrogenase [Thioclava sp. ES.031]
MEDDTDISTLALLGGAHVHLPDHLQHMKARGFRVGFVHDRDLERRDRLCAELDAKPLTTLDELVGLQAAGAVVCSETAHHAIDIGAALLAGLPTFSEKPLTGSARDAEVLAQQSAKAGVILHTAYFFRTLPALRKAKDWISEGRLGTVRSARMLFNHDGGYADWLDLDCWMTDPELACYDGFVDEAVHAIDALQWILGPVRKGNAVTGNALGWPLNDHGAAILRFASGATGVVEAGWTDTRMRLELDLVGDAGAISLKNGEMTLTLRGAESPTERVVLDPLDAGTGIVPFLSALKGRAAPGLVSAGEAARVNRVLDDLGLRLN